MADTGLSAVLLSMSNYGKTYVESEGNFIHQTSNSQVIFTEIEFLGYETTNSTDMYLAYTPQAMNPPPHLRGPFNRDEDQSYTPYDSVGITQQDESWQQSSESQQIPEIIDWSPKFGSQGTRIIINLRSTFAINTTTMNLSVKFGSVKSSASILTTLKADSTYFKYALHAEAPSHGLTGWNSQQVPIVVMAHDQSGIFITSLKLGGLFSYNSTAGILQASPNLSRKRRLSESDEVVIDFPPKRVATMPVKMDSNYNNDRSFVAFDEQNESYVQSPSHLGMATSMGSNYNRPILHTGDLHRGSPNQLHQQIDPTIPTQPRHAPSHVRSWSSSNLPGMFSRSPNMSGNMRRVNTMNTSSIATNPRLVRTSQISQAPSPASTPTVAPLSGNFSPYAVHPHKAQLKISGELDTMTQSWTPEECDVKRRLVQFWRSQTGSAITTTFAPVAPENRQPNAICISCIWWEEKDQYYVTSVDTIFLLESLVAVRFTVEEKNRIRRNLEGFRPLTVSKGKADSEDFFKLIMGFPNPKPRNIEKDVKVYPWTILALALKKIIGKYVSQLLLLMNIY